jgi:hypothetical protein
MQKRGARFQTLESLAARAVNDAMLSVVDAHADVEHAANHII